MGDADVDIVLRSIKGPDSTIPEAAFDGRGASRWWTPLKRLPSGQEFLRQLPEQARWAEETGIYCRHIQPYCTSTQAPLRGVCEHVAALAKITDKTTLMSVINGARPAAGTA